MRVRNIMMSSLGLAAAFTTFAGTLGAQDTTRLRRTTSQTRINVSKGEVELRVDTVFVTRYDTIRVDNTIVRVDTVTVETPAPIPLGRIVGPFFWSLFAGATAPASDIDRLYTNGYHAGGAIGWDPRTSAFGFRLAASFNQVGREQGRSDVLVGTGTPLMWQASADLKLKAPLGGWAFYGIGGLGFASYKRMATVADLDEADDVFDDIDDDFGDLDPDDVTVCGPTTDGEGGCFRLANNDDWRTKFSYNFGVGTDFRIGSQEMFLEARMVSIYRSGANTWFVPVSLGVRYF